MKAKRTSPNEADDAASVVEMLEDEGVWGVRGVKRR